MRKVAGLFCLLCICLFSLPTLAAETAALLVYQVVEPGLDPYVSRYLVNSHYLRLDEGANAPEGYTLFDRQRGVIYNISPEDQTVLVIDPPDKLPDPPPGLQVREAVELDQQAPLISGRRPSNVKLIANELVCVEAVSVAGLMDDAVKALVEFRQVLARVQGAVVSRLPEDSTSACDMAQHIHAATRTLEQGLPIVEKSPAMSQSLLDFDPSFQVTAELFRLPGDYRRIPMPGLSGH